MSEKQSVLRRWENYRVSKTVVFWACAGCIVATVIIGFTWGGWVTGGAAERMASQGATAARADLAATLCVSRFATGPDAVVNLASLKASDSWTRSDLIEKGGWATLAGTDKPVSGAADLCARRLMDAPPAAKAPGVSG
jgi:hypothetical protein